jgi:hypothetical protein
VVEFGLCDDIFGSQKNKTVEIALSNAIFLFGQSKIVENDSGDETFPLD